jgi:hypothetical protein
MTASRVLAYTTAAFLVIAVIAGTTILVHQPSRLERWYRAGLDQAKGKAPASNNKAGLQQWEETGAMIERLKRERDQLRRG